MKSKTPICVAIAMGIFGAFNLATADDVAATHSPVSPTWEAGCKWIPFESVKLGVKLLYQDCKQPNAQYVLSENGNKLEQHRPSDGRTFNGPVILELYAKPAELKIEEAIKRKFVDVLKGEAKLNCKVTRIHPPNALKSDDKLVFEIIATSAYEKKVAAEWSRSHPEGGKPDYQLCGDYGRQYEGLSYFEFHPGESKSNYAFVDCGMDEPLFDRDSIVFLKKEKSVK